MRCLCCGKPLKDNEIVNGWHKHCINNFFGTLGMPEIEITDEELQRLATESTGKGYTVPGVQKKLSLHLFSEGAHPRLTLVDYPTGYILKPQVSDFTALPEAEHLVMSMADVSGIKTVPHALIKGGEGYAYITKRVDRIFDNAGMVKLLAMEDFCQLDQRLTMDKYKGSYERCSKVIDRFSSRSGIDQTELFIRLVFCFIVGNSDMHLKNFSLIETGECTNQYVLSPAYDLLPVNIIMPEDKEEFALTMNGKKMHLRRKDFLIFADKCHISAKSASKMIAKLLSMKPIYISMCNDSFLPQELKDSFIDLMSERMERLEEL